ncbi:MAG TPA: c-type cytochrome biogenesis protein CcsB [Streptosporangiaceae bacterium]|jgi:cytochrome c-type biogenesis protein CcsB|nr:c-type cytochrome biogenesis protein CcsB [Streptosporangiaceae bacterium]
MSVNTGLSAVSDHLLMVAVVVYSLALLAYAGDFAYGRRARAAAKPVAQPVSELAGVGARGTDEPVGVSEAGDTPAVPATGEPPVSGGSDAISPGGLEKGRQARGPLIRAAIAFTFLGAALHLTGVITRGIAVDRVPWGDMYEFVTALTCVTVLFFIAVMLKYRAWHLGLFVMAAVVVALGLAQTVIYTPAGPLVPALKSYWLAIHVAAMTLSTGIFFVAAVLGVVYLFAERHGRLVAAGRELADHGIFRRLPGPEALDRLCYRTVVFGFPIWTFGIICGAIWADQAWGRYWGWDPVETWAFITWVVYACFLHARATAGWRGKRAAWIQIIGFACLLFNVLVVQTDVTGLHSYAGLS